MFQPFLYMYYLPCMAIVLVSQISFIIPLSSIPGRVALVVTQFLTLTNIFIHQTVGYMSFREKFIQSINIKLYYIKSFHTSLSTIISVQESFWSYVECFEWISNYFFILCNWNNGGVCSGIIDQKIV